MFLHFKNANTIHYKKSLSSIVINKKNVHKMSSVHGSSILTVISIHTILFFFNLAILAQQEITHKLLEEMNN